MKNLISTMVVFLFLTVLSGCSQKDVQMEPVILTKEKIIYINKCIFELPSLLVNSSSVKKKDIPSLLGKDRKESEKAVKDFIILLLEKNKIAESNRKSIVFLYNSYLDCLKTEI